MNGARLSADGLSCRKTLSKGKIGGGVVGVHRENPIALWDYS
jgi:hypothetical protein